MLGREVIPGLEVTLGGYPGEWLLVDRVEGKRVHVRRIFGEPMVYSSGFWIDIDAVRQAPQSRPLTASLRVATGSESARISRPSHGVTMTASKI